MMVTGVGLQQLETKHVCDYLTSKSCAVRLSYTISVSPNWLLLNIGFTHVRKLKLSTVSLPSISFNVSVLFETVDSTDVVFSSRLNNFLTTISKDPYFHMIWAALPKDLQLYIMNRVQITQNWFLLPYSVSRITNQFDSVEQYILCRFSKLSWILTTRWRQIKIIFMKLF